MGDLKRAEQTLAMITAVHFIDDPYEKDAMGTDAEIEELMDYWKREVVCLKARAEARRIDLSQPAHRINSNTKGDRR